MTNPGPMIEMTPDGGFVDPQKPKLATILARLAAFAAVLLVAAVAFWMAILIIPILIVLAIIGYFATRARFRRRL